MKKITFLFIATVLMVSLVIGCAKSTYPPAPSIEIIIDNADSGCTFDSPWPVDTYSPGYYGANYAKDGTSSADPGKWAKFTPNILTAGSYDVYMWWPADANRPSAAPLEISYDGGTDTSKTVDQTKNGDTWVFIGNYNFAAGTSGYVMIRASCPGYTIADAVKFVHNQPPSLSPSPSPTPGVTLNPTDDAYIRGGTYADTHYGTGTTMNVKNTTDLSAARKIYYKFNISSVSAVSSAILRLNGLKYATTETTLNSQLQVSGVASDDWTESGITWNNAPAATGGALDSIECGLAAIPRQWFEFDVTSYVQSKLASGVVSFILDDGIVAKVNFDFYSKDSTTKPELVIEP